MPAALTILSWLSHPPAGYWMGYGISGLLNVYAGQGELLGLLPAAWRCAAPPADAQCWYATCCS